MILLALVVSATLFLAYTNGANDNFKGVATLFGSGTTDYRRALIWATVTTLAGSLAGMWLGAELVSSFSGRGLVPDSVAADASFLGAVGFGAAITVLAATRFGFPISTTHAITGALVGAGLVAAGGEVVWSKLGGTFFLPLLASPVIAFAAALLIYPVCRFARARLGVNEESAIVIAGEAVPLPAEQALPADVVPGARFTLTDAIWSRLATAPRMAIGQEAMLVRRYSGAVVGVNAQQALDLLHYLSAGAAGFARGLNDAPKIVALMIAAKAMNIQLGLGLVAAAMAIGGALSARRIATTMSKRITGMNAGQGFVANLVTSLMVVVASRFGVPVSTTHVSCGALFGIGTVNRQARWRMIAQILLAWVITLPVAIAAAAASHLLLTAFG
jgi:PiT family inorganic phosphate transporter